METDYIVYIGTYPPRKCGIATFTQDLSTAVSKISRSLTSKIIALNDNGNLYNYSEDVLHQIRDKDVENYKQIAHKINEDEKIKLVSIQHEFKIFGSDHGENLLAFLRIIKKPVITTFHTILPAPSVERKEIVQLIAQHSRYIIVMSSSAVKILKENYNIEDSKVVIIPHGIHNLPYQQSIIQKERLGYENRLVLSSFGLLRPGNKRNSSGKGYEYVLDALPEVVKAFPNILYLILGATHPKTLKLEGEKYRHFLENKVKKLGIENNVQFIDKYLTLDELFQYLQASDVYVCSPLNRNQVTSGTLVYAMGCGRAVVSTPFLHAKDIVNHERGLLTEFGNPQSFSDAIIKILATPNLKETMGKNAYEYTRQMTWENVALSYLNLFKRCIPEMLAVSDGHYSGYVHSLFQAKSQVTPVLLFKTLRKK